MFQTVLLAWEQSHPPKRALASAGELARVFDARLVVAVLLLEHEHVNELSDLLPGIDRIVLPCRRPAHDLVEFAHEHGFDLLVVGHHPPERSHRIFSHDIAQEIVREADVPVLVVAEDESPPVGA
jgi:nucleotide-binding universal stress UspA family protein